MTEISEEEARLYDRQIRLWGLETQRRLRNANVLLIGVDGLTNEVAKNLVLGGVGSVTLVDDVVVTAADVARQFFLHGSGDVEEGDCDDNDSPIGMNRAIAIRERVAEMNPMVRVEARAVDSIAALLKDDAFIEPFDVVCMFNPVASVALRCNETCHRLGKKFFAGFAYGMHGQVFVDVGMHHYIMEKTESDKSKTKTEHCESWPTLKLALAARPFAGYKSLRKVRREFPTGLFLLMLTFRFQHGRAGRVPTAADLPTLQRLRTKLLVDECGMSADVVQAVVTDDALRDLCGERESSPVCAIVGGIMAQDVIRTVSGTGKPICNVFGFDARDLSGPVARMV